MNNCFCVTFSVILLAIVSIHAKPWIAEPRTDARFQHLHKHYLNETAMNKDHEKAIFIGASTVEKWNLNGKAIWNKVNKKKCIGLVMFQLIQSSSYASSFSIMHLVERTTMVSMEIEPNTCCGESRMVNLTALKLNWWSFSLVS